MKSMLVTMSEIQRAAGGDQRRLMVAYPRMVSDIVRVGQARGIALLVPARAGISVAEYAPNAVKKTVVGAGHADKAQIRAMVRVLLASLFIGAIASLIPAWQMARLDPAQVFRG